jgi:hypothetical protein
MAVTSFSRIALTDRVTNATAATLAVTEADHEGQTITLNRAAGIAVTLPASTGGGAKYRFVVGTSITSNSTTIKVANASDVMTGTAILFQDAGDTVVGFATVAASDTITMDGSTVGGLKGAHVMLEDIALNLWHVHYVSDASGTEATPFSATV